MLLFSLNCYVSGGGGGGDEEYIYMNKVIVTGQGQDKADRGESSKVVSYKVEPAWWCSTLYLFGSYIIN